MRVFTASACLGHQPPPGHPEQPARLEAVLARLRSSAAVELRRARPAPAFLPQLVHEPEYLQRLEAMSTSGSGEFDPDTPVGPETWEAALAALGASLAALEYSLANRQNSFAAIRPPGHHALKATAMGFCYLNQVAILAMAARQHGLQKILIVDWDVHHGNGTQALVASEPMVRFVSMHQAPWWPGTGSGDERGVGNIFNLPLPGGLDPEKYLEGLWDVIQLATTNWTPELILISAGYDSMLGDPLGGFTLAAEHYAEWVNRLRNRAPTAPLVALMEGGYSPEHLAEGVLATVEAMQ